MKLKERDELYCGVRKEFIQNSLPVLNEDVVKLHNHWIFERYRVKLKKESGQPSPWTSDPILRDYRFTNVRRWDDRESQYVIQNISLRTDMSLENKFYNTLFSRMYNKWETVEKLGGLIDWNGCVDLENYRSIILRKMNEDPKYVWFTNAYNMGGMKRAAGSDSILIHKSVVNREEIDYNDEEIEVINNLSEVLVNKPKIFAAPGYLATKVIGNDLGYELITLEDDLIPLRIIKRVKQLKKQKLFERVMQSKNQQEVFEILNSVRGYGTFLAYQLFVDMTYIPEFPFSNNEFAMCGPGTTRGLGLLFEDKVGMTDPECIFWMRDNLVRLWGEMGLENDLKSLMTDLPEDDRILCVSDITNTLCELTKYYRAVHGVGRPKVKYSPFKDNDLEQFLQ